jgi:predicted signal transduction protein with EAL and GGDEF domain
VRGERRRTPEDIGNIKSVLRQTSTRAAPFLVADRATKLRPVSKLGTVNPNRLRGREFALVVDEIADDATGRASLCTLQEAVSLDGQVGDFRLGKQWRSRDPFMENEDSDS